MQSASKHLLKAFEISSKDFRDLGAKTLERPSADFRRLSAKTAGIKSCWYKELLRTLGPWGAKSFSKPSKGLLKPKDSRDFGAKSFCIQTFERP